MKHVFEQKGVHMKHNLLKSRIAVLLIVCLISGSTAYATTTQDQIEKAKDQISDIIDKKEDAENAVDEISSKMEGLETDLSKLNGQLTELTASINELELEITEKEEEINTAEAALSDAKQQYAKQYEDMKLRIQFMYENSNTSAWAMLLTASSFTDFLNRTEYISKINEYDRQKLKEFQELGESIEEQKLALEADMTELLALQEDMQQKQDSVNGLISTTKNNIAAAGSELDDAQSEVQDLENALAKMIEYEKQLEIQKAKEDAARLEEIRRQEQEDTSGVIYVPAESDQYLLGAIIQCEAEGEPYEGKLAVGSVIMNRVKSSYFPNTISGVVYQSGQFSPVASGRLAYRLSAGVNNECLQAAQEVLNGTITLNCLFFRTNNGIIQGTVIGNHVFY